MSLCVVIFTQPDWVFNTIGNQGELSLGIPAQGEDMPIALGFDEVKQRFVTLGEAHRIVLVRDNLDEDMIEYFDREALLIKLIRKVDDLIILKHRQPSNKAINFIIDNIRKDKRTHEPIHSYHSSIDGIYLRIFQLLLDDKKKKKLAEVIKILEYKLEVETRIKLLYDFLDLISVESNLILPKLKKVCEDTNEKALKTEVEGKERQALISACGQFYHAIREAVALATPDFKRIYCRELETVRDSVLGK